MEISGLHETALSISVCDAGFMCVIYIFMLFPSLKFPYGFFLYHLGIDLQSLEVGRFFPNSSETRFRFIISALGILFDAGGYFVCSVTRIPIWCY